MLLPRFIVGILLAGVLAGCGFRPLYGTSGDSNVANSLSRIDVQPIPDRIGQQVRNGLASALAPRGPQGERLFILTVEVTEGISSLAVKKSAFATRADLRLSASFNLINAQGRSSLLSSDSSATSSFNILNSEFATLMAEKSARERAITQLVDDIRSKLAVFLKN